MENKEGNVTDKEFRRLGRGDLIEMIYTMQKNEEHLQKENNSFRERLKEQPVENPRSYAIEKVMYEHGRRRKRKQFRHLLGNTLSILLVVAAVAVLLVTLFLPVLQVSGSSMEPTLKDGDVIVLVKTADFETGDLCAVRVSGNVLLKRMIAGPGDWVNIDNEGNVYVNGELFNEPYVTDKALGISDRKYPYQVPDGSIFVMGDHRSVSLDSRSSQVGCIPYDQVIGRVIIRIWPLTKISLVS